MAVAGEAQELEALVRAACAEIATAGELQALLEVRARFLGKRGSLSALLRGLGALPPAERAHTGEQINRAKEQIEEAVRAQRAALEQRVQERALAERALDVSLPGVCFPRGRMHPVRRQMREIAEYFHGTGFSLAEGPEVESEYYNFEALNTPADHPARDLQDTFFVESGAVLRTHTSPVQIRAMTGRTPPFRFIAMGRVYRRDSDPTHSPMFHQIEGFWVDEHTSFADLKGLLYDFARFMFGAEVELRFRAHFFPFTEPSAELDFSWEGRWLEWGGCGMIHPRVLANCGIDSERYQGFAFGMGIDRSAMLRYGIPHIQHLFEGDLRVLEQL